MIFHLFKAGIDEGAEAVLVSHNTIKNIDDKNPASLSPSVHNLLRNELGFTGIIITDDLAMVQLVIYRMRQLRLFWRVMI